MRWLPYATPFFLLASCGERSSFQSLGGLGLVKVYTNEEQADAKCETFLKALRLEQEVQGTLISQSLTDFEVDGFATIHIPHVPSKRNLTIVVTVTEPDSGAPIGYGCAQNIEVRKGAIRDIPIILEANDKGLQAQPG